MPQKTPQERAKRSKAKGLPMSVKATDVRDTRGKSNHANKKSKGIVRERAFYERSVSARGAPGEGRHTSPDPGLHPDGAASRFRKDGRRKTPARDGNLLPRATVNGRKKRPSRMNVKSKGGPRKRMPIHGG